MDGLKILLPWIILGFQIYWAVKGWKFYKNGDKYFDEAIKSAEEASKMNKEATEYLQFAIKDKIIKKQHDINCNDKIQDNPEPRIH